jgi:hypothetical protein
MAKPFLRTAILDKLTRQIAGAARVAQKRIVKEFGSDCHRHIFGLCDQLVHALGEELRNLALEGSSVFAHSAGCESQGSADIGCATQEPSGASTFSEASGPMKESEVNALVEDRLQCIKPYLQHELRRATSPPDTVPPVSRFSKLSRDVSSHVRRRDAHVVVSGLGERDLKNLQRGGRRVRNGTDSCTADCAFAQHFRDAQRAMEHPLHGVSIDNDQLSFIAAYVAEAVQNKLNGIMDSQACSSFLKPPGADASGFLAPGTWTDFNAEAEIFVPNSTPDSEPSDLNTGCTLRENCTRNQVLEVNNHACQDFFIGSTEACTQTTHSGDFGSTMSLHDVGTSTDDSPEPEPHTESIREAAAV